MTTGSFSTHPAISFDGQALLPPTPEMSAFVAAWDRAESNIDSDDERRAVRRFPMTMPIPAVEIDADFQPVGIPFTVFTRDISTRGIALVHSHALDAKRLAIELTGAAGEKIQVVLDVLRSTAIHGFYEIGCRYVCRLGQREG